MDVTKKKFCYFVREKVKTKIRLEKSKYNNKKSSSVGVSMRYINPLVLSSNGKRDRLSSTSISHEISIPSPNKYLRSNNSINSSNKRMKSSTMTQSNSLSSHRFDSLGISNEEVITNSISIDEIIHQNTNTYNKQHRRDGSLTSKADTDTINSESGTTTDGSIVAQLREKLQDFEQKNHTHFLKNNIIPSKDELEKPLRPKVKPTAKDKPGPTPLPKHSADALARRMMEQHSNSSLATTTPSIFRQRSTPVRLRIVPKCTEDVQATNEGYASVAKLSKWLADDPTSSKKVKQLRRGANIIAKSRKFDKVLANAEVEQVIPRNCVTRQKILLQKALSHDNEDIYDDDNNINDDKEHNTYNNEETKPDWMNLGTTASLSVSDKKKWLSNAFQGSGSTIENTTTTVGGSIAQPSPYKQAGKARTDIMSSSRSSDFGMLAKEKWRQRTTPTKGAVNVSSTTSSMKEVIPMSEISQQMNNMDTVKRHNGSSITNSNVIRSIVHNNNNNVNDDDNGTSGTVDFHLARDMLIQRSKVNGNKVDVMTPFQRRKMKFQQLEKEASTAAARRQSSLHKPSWDNAPSGGGSGYYVKTLKEDIAPKKALNDLP